MDGRRRACGMRLEASAAARSRCAVERAKAAHTLHEMGAGRVIIGEREVNDS